MGNHYHLLVKTIDANLSKAMQWFGVTGQNPIVVFAELTVVETLGTLLTIDS